MVSSNRPARKVIDQLVQAIGNHRTATRESGPPRAADRQLWAVLRGSVSTPTEFDDEHCRIYVR
jgi:hypothetical protein